MNAADVSALTRMQGSVFIKLLRADNLLTTAAGTSLVRDLYPAY
jgi:hypothetical protein